MNKAITGIKTLRRKPTVHMLPNNIFNKVALLRKDFFEIQIVRMRQKHK